MSLRPGARRAARAAALLAALAVVLLLGTPPAHATFPGSNGKIAFGGGPQSVHRMNPDGSNQELVRSGAVSPVWSSDGTKLAVLTGPSASEIVVMNPDGTAPVVVCQCVQNHPTTLAYLAWSPDGAKFAWDERDPVTNTVQIRVVNSDGTGETALTSAGNNRYPAWSPDGTKIAFVSNRSPEGVWVMNADGTGQTALGTPTAHRRPSWSPDGSRIAFGTLGDGSPGTVRSIVTMNADGSNQTPLTTNNVGFDDDPAWSPDGQHIAYQSDDVIHVMNADGSDQTPIVSGERPDWQPIPPSYVRPGGATPVRASLVPAYDACTAPNRTHGPPLAFGSCNPSQQSSTQLTVGTPDANGHAARFAGFARLSVKPGNPGTQTDEADVLLSVAISDVRMQSDLSDYEGELEAQVTLRATDKHNTPFLSTPATVVDQTLSFAVPCVASAGPGGADCAVATTADALVPSWVAEGRRTIWELGQVRVFDGGPDGVADTAGNTLFAVQGIFVP